MSREIILPSGFVLRSENFGTPAKKDHFPPEKWEKGKALLRAGAAWPRPYPYDLIIIADDSPFSSREKLQEFVGGREISEPASAEVARDGAPDSRETVKYCEVEWAQFSSAYRKTNGGMVRLVFREGASEKIRRAYLAESLRETERVI